MWQSRIPLDRAERSANVYAPFVSYGLIYCWMFGALVPLALVTPVFVLLQEAVQYLEAMFAGRVPRPFGTVTVDVIGLFFSGKFEFLDARWLADPMVQLRVALSICGSIWLVVRVLRHRIGLPEIATFLVIASFSVASVTMTLAALAPRAIEQLFLPLTEQGGTYELLEATHLLGMLACAVWVALYAMRSFLKVEPLARWEIQVCADEPAPASGLTQLALRMTGVPRNIGVADRKLRTAVLMYFANVSSLVPMIVVFGAIPGIAFAVIGFVKLTAGAIHLNAVFDLSGKPMPLHFWLAPPIGLVTSIGAEALKAGVLLGIGYVLRTWGLRYVQTSIGLAQRRDQRPPVLFLRPFVTDSIPLAAPPTNLVGKIFSVPVHSASLDAVVLDEGSVKGPVVAVGDPGEPPPAYGASRGYFQHQSWQKAVTRLAVEAQTIVLVVGQSEGVGWEMELVATSGHLHKTLFVMPPDATDGDRSAALVYFERLGVQGIEPDLYRAEGGAARLIAAWIDEHGVCHQLSSANGNSTSYRLALRTYLRCAQGVAV